MRYHMDEDPKVRESQGKGPVVLQRRNALSCARSQPRTLACFSARMPALPHPSTCAFEHRAVPPDRQVLQPAGLRAPKLPHALPLPPCQVLLSTGLSLLPGKCYSRLAWGPDYIAAVCGTTLHFLDPRTGEVVERVEDAHDAAVGVGAGCSACCVWSVEEAVEASIICFATPVPLA